MSESRKEAPAAQYGSTYPLPYDDVEKQRLRKQHLGLVGIMHNNPIHAPIDTIKPKKIVDVGCGVNADMTVYFAQRFPNAQIYGVDLSPVAIPKEHVPSNVEFIQGNITDLLDTDPRLASGSVDFLFSRLLAAGMQNWKEYIQMVAKLLSPGGMTEMQELANADLSRDGKPVVQGMKWWPFTWEMMTGKLGLDMGTFVKADGIMREVGLVDAKVIEIPLNWGAAKDESEKVWEEEGRASWYAALTHVVKMAVADKDPDVQKEVIDDLFRTTMPPKEGMHFPFYVAWGRKPGERKE